MAFAQNYPMLHCPPQFEARAILAPTRPVAQCLQCSAQRGRPWQKVQILAVLSHCCSDLSKTGTKVSPQMTKPQQFLS